MWINQKSYNLSGLMISSYPTKQDNNGMFVKFISNYLLNIPKIKGAFKMICVSF